MASEDVIELGSSEEEAEPERKKTKIKRKPNVMVHIPNTITSKPKKSKDITPILPKDVAIKRVPIKQPIKPANPPQFIRSSTVGTNQRFALRNMTPMTKTLKLKSAINPINVISKMGPRYPIVRHVNKVTPININQQIKNSAFATQLPMLPDSVTIKKTSTKKVVPMVQAASPNKRIARLVPKTPRQLLTVELDDEDEATASTGGPQWYIRPEEQATTLQDQEDKNNAEPETSNYTEILIEDSPVKLTSNKTHEIEVELPITIEDSPNKGTPKKRKHKNNSDNESDKTPHSKKKLKYPAETDNKIEVEIEPMETTLQNFNDKTQVEKEGQSNNDEILNTDSIIEIEDTPIKEINQNESTPKKIECSKPIVISKGIKQLNVLDDNDVNSEYHPVYQSFINTCFELENSEDMKRIVEKKIKNYYRQVPKEYTESEEFTEMVASKVSAMKAGPSKMYLYIKDVVDELNMQRKMVKAKVTEVEPKKQDEATEKFLYGEESEFDERRQRQIRKLEKTIKKLHRAIQKLEEQEVDFDDEEDSVYLLTERYKERMVKVHAKLCQLTNSKLPSEPRIIIETRPGQPKGPSQRLEKWINKKVPIGTPLPFPDFHDVLKCVRDANKEDNLGWNEADIMEEARDLFTRCGKKLQRRRQENEWRMAASRITIESDPAESSEELKRLLEQNRSLATKKETDVFNKYADKQNQLNLEAVEIGDKEAEESPSDSEEDDVKSENTAVEGKNKRKEGILKLLQKKFKKDYEKVNDGLQDKDMDDNLCNTKVNTEDSISNKDKLEVASTSKCELGGDKNENRESQSDVSSKLESDIDELHLLQKLHSDKEMGSTMESSDSESPIAISDSLESGSDTKIHCSDDVISIENSSYSESENKEYEKATPKAKSIDDGVDINTNLECIAEKENKIEFISSDNTGTVVTDPFVENVLLALTDDEEISNDGDAGSINSQDCISVGETVVSEVNTSHFKHNEILIDNDTTNGHQEKCVDTDSKEITSEEMELISCSKTACSASKTINFNSDTSVLNSISNKETKKLENAEQIKDVCEDKNKVSNVDATSLVNNLCTEKSVINLKISKKNETISANEKNTKTFVEYVDLLVSHIESSTVQSKMSVESIKSANIIACNNYTLSDKDLSTNCDLVYKGGEISNKDTNNVKTKADSDVTVIEDNNSDACSDKVKAMDTVLASRTSEESNIFMSKKNNEEIEVSHSSNKLEEDNRKKENVCEQSDNLVIASLPENCIDERTDENILTPEEISLTSEKTVECT